MRICWILILMAAGLSAAGPAVAGEVTAPSKIEAVTVFPSGAEITRVIKVRLEAGEHTLIIGDITREALPASIRVEATASGKLEIGSVDTRQLSLSSSDPAVALSARKKIEDQIEVLDDSRGVQDGVIQAAEMQRSYLENLAKLPQTPAGSGASASREDWAALYGVIGASMSDIAKTVTGARLKQREIDRQLEDLRKQLETAGGNNVQARTEVRIYVSAAEPLDAALTLRYQTTSASWSPFYDARLAIGDKDKGSAPSLTLTRRASVLQTTGEDWDGVTLALSTTRPGATTAAPELKTLAVDFAGAALQDRRGVGGKNLENSAMGGKQFAQERDDDLEENRIAQRSTQQRVAEKTVSATVTAFQAVYAIAGRTVIKSTGEAKRMQIITEDIEPALTVQTVPRINPTAYLYARLTLPANSSPILQGQVSLFRDGVFVGNGQMPQLSPGESHDLGFGADERVKVKRVVLEDKKGETGTFTTSHVEERRYAIILRNLHNRAVQVQVIDRIPVPLQQDITVDFKVHQGPQPAENDVNGKRGVVMWRISAEPGEEKQISFGYRLTAPAGNPILYGEVGEEQEALEKFRSPARNRY